jgi:hypothetical protein
MVGIYFFEDQARNQKPTQDKEKVDTDPPTWMPKAQEAVRQGIAGNGDMSDQCKGDAYEPETIQSTIAHLGRH